MNTRPLSLTLITLAALSAGAAIAQSNMPDTKAAASLRFFEMLFGLGREQGQAWLSAHLGNGCSTCAIVDGQSRDPIARFDGKAARHHRIEPARKQHNRDRRG